MLYARGQCSAAVPADRDPTLPIDKLGPANALPQTQYSDSAKPHPGPPLQGGWQGEAAGARPGEHSALAEARRAVFAVGAPGPSNACDALGGGFGAGGGVGRGEAAGPPRRSGPWEGAPTLGPGSASAGAPASILTTQGNPLCCGHSSGTWT